MPGVADLADRSAKNTVLHANLLKPYKAAISAFEWDECRDPTGVRYRWGTAAVPLLLLQSGS